MIDFSKTGPGMYMDRKGSREAIFKVGAIFMDNHRIEYFNNGEVSYPNFSHDDYNLVSYERPLTENEKAEIHERWPGAEVDSYIDSNPRSRDDSGDNLCGDSEPEPTRDRTPRDGRDQRAKRASRDCSGPRQIFEKGNRGTAGWVGASSIREEYETVGYILGLNKEFMDKFSPVVRLQGKHTIALLSPSKEIEDDINVVVPFGMTTRHPKDVDCVVTGVQIALARALRDAINAEVEDRLADVEKRRKAKK